MTTISGGGVDLDRWLAPFLAVLGRKTRRTWAPLYLRGLLGPGERKSLQLMAARQGLSGHDQLQHFIASTAWDDAPLWSVLAQQADRLVGGPQAWLVIDDTALPKKGTLSVGVAPQYCGQLGKKANCQSLVSLTLAQGEVPAPVGLRLFLPKEWIDDPDRCAGADVPEVAMTLRAKGEIALDELDRLTAAGCGSARCWPMRATARVRHSARAWMPGAALGRWAFRATRRSTALPCSWCRHRDGVESLFPAKPRWRRRRSWPGCPGVGSPGGRASRARWRPGSPRHASGWATGRCGVTTVTYRATKPGWWANGARAANGNTISATCLLTRHSAPWRPPSRAAGYASRRTNN